MKTKYIWLPLLLIFVLTAGCQQTQETATTTTTTSTTTTRPLPTWAGTQQFGSAADDYCYSLLLDNNDNPYLVGDTSGTLEGNTHEGLMDIFLAKFSAAGAREWLKQIGTVSNEASWGAGIGADGNIYAGVSTRGNWDGVANAGLMDALLIKFNSSGEKQWSRQLGTVGDEYVYAVAVDDDGNVYIAGNTTRDFDGQSHTNETSYDIFLVKYDASGTKQWSRLIGSTAHDFPYGLTLDGSGNIFITGATESSLEGNTHYGGSDMHLIKYQTDGTKVWAKQFGTAVSDKARAVYLDNGGNIYLAGFTAGDMEGANAGGEDIVLMKCDSDGVQQWVRQFGTAGADTGYDMVIDGSDNIYLTGGVTGALPGDTDNGEADIFLAKYDTSGNQLWVKQFGSADGEFGFSMKIDSHGYIYVGGNAQGGVDGNTGAGGVDPFLMRFSPDGVKQ